MSDLVSAAQRIRGQRNSVHHLDCELTIKRWSWLAAVTECDTGLPVKVRPGGSQTSTGEPIPGTYSITVGSISASSFWYHDVWTYLSGVSAAARALGLEET